MSDTPALDTTKGDYLLKQQQLNQLLSNIATNYTLTIPELKKKLTLVPQTRIKALFIKAIEADIVKDKEALDLRSPVEEDIVTDILALFDLRGLLIATKRDIIIEEKELAKKKEELLSKKEDEPNEQKEN